MSIENNNDRKNKIIKTGIIYMLRSKNDHDCLCYIGSTSKTLTQRLDTHQRHYREYLDGKRRNKITSFPLIKLGNCFMKELKVFENITRKELEKKEGEIILQNKKCPLEGGYCGVVLNKNIAGRTREEYNQLPEVKERKKEHSQLPEIVEKRKEYNKLPEVRRKRFEYDNAKVICCDCGKEYVRKMKEIHVAMEHEGKTKEQYLDEVYERDIKRMNDNLEKKAVKKIS